MQLLPTRIHIWCTVCDGKQPLCSRRSDLLKTLLSKSRMCTVTGSSILFTHMSLYVFRVCHVVVCFCLSHARMSASLWYYCPLPPAESSSIRKPTYVHAQIPTDQNTALHQIQWKACSLMIWCEDNRRLEREMETGERGRERKGEVRGESGWGSEAIGEWPTAGALLSAIVKELGGIIGLLSSMRSMHF